MIGKKTKFVLDTLNARETRSLKRFIGERIENNDLIRAITYITFHKPPKINSEALWSVMFPAFLFDEKKLRIRMSKLNRFIEDFLVTIELSESLHTKNLLLLRQLRRRKLYKHFDQISKKLSKDLLKSQPQSQHYFESISIFQQESAMRQVEATGNLRAEVLSSIIENEELRFVTTILRFKCDAIQYNEVYSSEALFPRLDQALQPIILPRYIQNPIVSFYYQFLQTLKKPNILTISKLTKEIGPLVQEMDPHEYQDAYLKLLNHCVDQINKGEGRYQKPYLEIVKSGLKSKGLFNPYDDSINVRLFGAIVTLSIRDGQLNWATKFISRYAAKVPENDRKWAIPYNNAVVLFEKERYSEALKSIAMITGEDIFLGTQLRVLMIKCYYEQGADSLDSLLFLCESFRIFLSSKARKFSKIHLRNYLTFNRIVKRLSLCRRHTQLHKIQIEFTNTVSAERNWIEQKIIKKFDSL